MTKTTRKTTAIFAALMLPIAATAADGSGDGWQNLFADDLSNAEFDRTVWSKDAEGCLTATKDVAIWTRDQYGRFELECEYNLEPAANSGILVYCTNPKDWIPNAVEVQLLDNDAPKWKNLDPRQANLSFFGHKAPTSNPAKPAGQWNVVRLVADGPRLALWLNGTKVNECDLSEWTDAKRLPDGSAIPPWLSRPWSDLPHAGQIGFQGRHAGAGVRFRGIRIRPLPPKPRKTLRLMSFNVRMGCGLKDPFLLPKDSSGHLPQCADVIRRVNPDVVGVQEVDCRSKRAGGVDQTARLASLAGMKGVWVEKIKDYGISMLYREPPFRTSKVLMPGSLHTRALETADFGSFVVANTHFPLAEWACTNAARIVRESLAGIDKPVFLMGDLNSVPQSAAIKSLAEDFVVLSDVSQMTFRADKPSRCIDYILVDRRHAETVRVRSTETIAAPEATDHCAVVVELELR